MVTVTCRHCGDAFTNLSIMAAMTDRRDHEEQRHYEGEIETDT